MASFVYQTYTPKYNPPVYISSPSNNLKQDIYLNNERHMYTSTKQKLDHNQLQIPTDNKSFKLNINQVKQTARKPRASAFQLYKGQDLQQDMPEETIEYPKMTRTKTNFDLNNNHQTKYFTNFHFTKAKRANSHQESPTKANRKNNQINKQRLNGVIIKTTQKPSVFKRHRQSLIDCAKTESSNQVNSQPNLNRFKSPPVNDTLREQFQRIMDGTDPQLFDRKTHVSTKSKVSDEKVIMTKKQLQIMELKHSLSQVEKQRMQQKLNWYQKQKSLISTIHSLQKEVRDHKDENNVLQKSLNHQQKQNNFISSSGVEEQLYLKQMSIKQLQNKNNLLTSALINLQSTFNQMNEQFVLERSILTSELSKVKQANINLSTQSNIQYNNNFNGCNSLVNLSVAQQFKRHNQMNEQYIKMLQMKIDMMQNELNDLRFKGSKLTIVQKLLGQYNQSILKYCMRKSEQQFRNLIN